jgi:hypothetical protein
MKRLLLIVMLMAMALVTGCTSIQITGTEQEVDATSLNLHLKETEVAASHSDAQSNVELLSVPDNPAVTSQVSNESVAKIENNVFLPKEPRMSDTSAVEPVIQKVEFRSGISSVTVEKIAKQYGCNTDKGAWLVGDKGPIEIYKVSCDQGSVFLVRCELRQCQPMPH